MNRPRKKTYSTIQLNILIFSFTLFSALIATHILVDEGLSVFLVLGSFTGSLLCFSLMGWGLFIRPYRILKNSRSKLRQAKIEAEKIAQFPLNNPHPLIQISLDGVIEYANPAAYSHYNGLENLGLNHPALIGLGDFIARAEKKKSETLTITREVLYENIVYNQTISSVLTGGRQALMIYSYDITAIKEAQEKARLLEAAIVSAKDGVIITTADLADPKIVYVNDAFSRISGYEADEVIGKTPRILQGMDTDKKILAKLKESLEKGKPFTGELKNYTKDKIAYWLDISIVPVKDEKGTVTHFAAIERDITSRKAFEKELMITREAAEVANRAKGDFLANMSHELRTPMNGIIGLSELLTEMEMPHDQQELAGAINSSSRNLLILLNDILDLSKIEAGELSLENIPFDLRRAVRQTVDLLKPMSSRKSVVLECTINPIVPERVIGDPARLQQILNNLISNAIKFTEVGYVRLDMTSVRDKAGDPVLMIRVEDTGIGIPEEKREAIFNKFTQADVSTARKYGGTGLGLAITKELVEMMGGEITVDSLEGKGTTFYVEIPVEVTEMKEELDTQNKKSNMTIPIDTSAKIMIVDDHPVNLLFMRKVLKKLGFKDVDEANGGRESIDLAQNKKYDLIFMDCQMPEMDGFEASAKIREMEDFANQVKIIAVTADAMKGARERCIDNGMNDYISKPVDVEKLKAILGEWLPGDGEAGEVIDFPHETDQNENGKVMDWDRLRMFTDGDPQEEMDLIVIFTAYAEESISILKARCKDGANEDWQKAAHKLKGSAANLGAQILSDICYEAETGFAESAETKEEILERILVAYQQVCRELNDSQAKSLVK